MRKNCKYLYAFFYVWAAWAMPAFAVFTLADVQEMKSLPLVQLKSNASGVNEAVFLQYINRSFQVDYTGGGANGTNAVGERFVA